MSSVQIKKDRLKNLCQAKLQEAQAQPEREAAKAKVMQVCNALLVVCDLSDAEMISVPAAELSWLNWDFGKERVE